ncbi:unnamed protein product [Clonostachys solani]|uniref:Major facilitator superfamily (MFS) profile domain-containing protein n=1 Tax=Clonostachys solani TaxID=160281 RepID=A0A9N9ZPF3_9HYPO|nr:unnamed protein product [Clonostachys solani]
MTRIDSRCGVGRRFLLPFLCLVLFVTQLGLSLSNLPSLRLMQDVICKKQLGIASYSLLPEGDCHADGIQQELNLATTGSLISTTVGGALVALPFGVLSDRLGRVPVLGLSVVGLFLSQAYADFVIWMAPRVPLTAIWGSGVPLLIGGGRSMAESMVFALISDIIPAPRRVLWFQCIAAAVIAGQATSPILAGYLMELSPWIPLWVSLGLIFAGGLSLTLFTPETLPISTPISDDPGKDGRQPAKSIRTALRFLFSRPAIALLPGSILAIPLASAQADVITRLMPLQFSWSLWRSSLLLSLNSAGTITTLLVILPVLACLFSRMDPLRRDVILVRVSATLLMFGSLALTMITSEGLVITGVVVLALSSGVPTLCRSLLVSQLPDTYNTGSVFGMIALGETLGFICCFLSMGALFDVGVRVWIGLPFCFGVALAILIGATTWSFRVPQTIE